MQEHPNLDPDAQLFFSLCYGALPGEPGESASEYLTECENEIRVTAQVFGWLFLAERDEEATFGWKPSAELKMLVSSRLGRRRSKKTKPSAQDRDIIECVQTEAAPGCSNASLGYAMEVLVHLGLIRYTESFAEIPSNMLCERVARRRNLERMHRLWGRPQQ
jgi:hypothetical protein